jgi:hypothetical protein
MKQWFIGVGGWRPNAYLSIAGIMGPFDNYWFPSVAKAIAIMHKYLEVIKPCSKEEDVKEIFNLNNLEPGSYIFDIRPPANFPK